MQSSSKIWLGWKLALSITMTWGVFKAGKSCVFEPLHKEITRHTFLVNHRSYKLSVYLSCNNWSPLKMPSANLFIYFLPSRSPCIRTIEVVVDSRFINIYDCVNLLGYSKYQETQRLSASCSLKLVVFLKRHESALKLPILKGQHNQNVPQFP